MCDFFITFRFSRYLHVSFCKSSTFRFAGFTKLNPQRWYLTAKDRSASQLAASAKLSRIAIKVVGNGQATGIEDIHVVSDGYAQSKQGIYDLQGRKLNQEPTHGIYIKNGKKYVK